MSTPAWEVANGDARDVLPRLRAGCVQTCITSPPYFGLRDYGHAGQIGREQTVTEYVEALVSVFREVRRVLRDDGTLWLNLGDSYASAGGAHNGRADNQRGVGAKRTHDAGGGDAGPRTPPNGLKPKDLIGIPWRVALALQADGWWLRQDIIWAKPNPMPESVTDRCTKAHEYLFLLAKSERYYFDAEAIKEPAVGGTSKGDSKRLAKRAVARTGGAISGGVERSSLGVSADGARNRRSVWTIATRPYKGAHFATFPETLVEPCVLAGSPPAVCSACGAPRERRIERRAPEPNEAASTGNAEVRADGGSRERAPSGAGGGNVLATVRVATDTFDPACECGAPDAAAIVLDPFAGSGTTLACAIRHGRRAVGCELNPDYAALAEARIANAVRP